MTLVVGVLEARLRVRSSRSLKAKRKVARSILDRLRSRYNVSVAEIDDQDLWQSLVIGVVKAGSDTGVVVRELEEIVRQLGMHPHAELLDHELEIL